MISTWHFFLASAYWPWFWGLIGLLIGSFLNVVIIRLPLRMDWGWKMECHVFQGGEEAEFKRNNPPPPDLVFAKSRCPHCGHNIRPWENVPVLGYLWLRGKCGGCKTPFSAQYPMVEALTGILFFIVASLTRDPLMAMAMMAFVSMLIACSGIDAKTKILPDVIVYPLLWTGLLVSALHLPGAVTPENALFGAIAGYLVLWTVYWVFKLITKREGMGYGDFKLLAAIGAWLGWAQLPWVLLISTVVGAVVGVVALTKQGQGYRIAIPFGPFLAAAGIITWIVGQLGWLPTLAA